MRGRSTVVCARAASARARRARLDTVAVAMALAAAVPGVLTACEPAYPGEALGTYTLVATLERHGCGGAAVPVRDRLSYEVELRADRGVGYWRRPGEPLVSGLCDGRSFSFGASVLVPVLAPDPDTGYPGCTLEQRQTIAGTVVPVVAADGGGVPGADAAPTGGAGTDGDAGPGGASDGGTNDGARSDGAATDGGTTDGGAPTLVEATDEIVFAPAPGSDCTPLLAAAGGPWTALPCTIRYRIVGTAAQAR
jgi:hypothetical protein